MKQYVFSVLSAHAKIHRHLDGIERHYRDVLRKVEEKEILAYDDDARFERLEDMKAELLQIRFRDPSP